MTPDRDAAARGAPAGRFRRWLASESFAHVHLGLLFTLLLIQPLRGLGAFDQVLAHSSLLAVMTSGVVAVGHSRWRLWSALLLALPMSVLGLFESEPSSVETAIGLTTGGLFMGFCTACLLMDLFHERRVLAGSISKALGAYIMLGLFWAFAYALLAGVDPGALQGLPGQQEGGAASGRLGPFVYFSMITMTTVGYGDITPVSDAARALVELEALAGQIVLVVLVARLVGMQVATSMTGARDADG